MAFLQRILGLPTAGEQRSERRQTLIDLQNAKNELYHYEKYPDYARRDIPRLLIDLYPNGKFEPTLRGGPYLKLGPDLHLTMDVHPQGHDVFARLEFPPFADKDMAVAGLVYKDGLLTLDLADEDEISLLWSGNNLPNLTQEQRDLALLKFSYIQPYLHDRALTAMQQHIEKFQQSISKAADLQENHAEGARAAAIIKHAMEYNQRFASDHTVLNVRLERYTDEHYYLSGEFRVYTDYHRDDQIARGSFRAETSRGPINFATDVQNLTFDTLEGYIDQKALMPAINNALMCGPVFTDIHDAAILVDLQQAQSLRDEQHPLHQHVAHLQQIAEHLEEHTSVRKRDLAVAKGEAERQKARGRA